MIEVRAAAASANAASVTGAATLAPIADAAAIAVASAAPFDPAIPTYSVECDKAGKRITRHAS